MTSIGTEVRRLQSVYLRVRAITQCQYPTAFFLLCQGLGNSVLESEDEEYREGPVIVRSLPCPFAGITPLLARKAHLNFRLQYMAMLP